MELKDVMIGERVATLEQVAKDLAELVKDHEGRIRRAERILYYGMGVLGTLGFLLHALEKFMKL